MDDDLDDVFFVHHPVEAVEIMVEVVFAADQRLGVDLARGDGVHRPAEVAHLAEGGVLGELPVPELVEGEAERRTLAAVVAVAENPPAHLHEPGGGVDELLGARGVEEAVEPERVAGKKLLLMLGIICILFLAFRLLSAS